MIEQVIFQSISEIPAWIESHPRQMTKKTSVSTGASKSWDYGLGMDGALEMAADGGYWAEGAAKMIEATSAMELLKDEGTVREIDMDVTGPVLDMDAFLSGDPECYENVVDDVPAPVISIGVQQYTPGGNHMDEFINRGAALLSVIQDLEDQGIRVELWGCVSGINRKNDGTGIDMRTLLKAAEDVWSPSSVAFGLCHAAFGRRLGFRVVESFSSLDAYCRNGHTLKYSEDRPADSDFQVWFGYSDMTNCGSGYSTAERALKKVTKEVERQLKDGNYGKENS